MTKAMNFLPASAKPVAVQLRHFALLLLGSFSSFDLSAVLEVLKEANRFDGTTRYRWTILSEDGGAVEASNGMSMSVDDSLSTLDCRERVLVFGGENYLATSTPPVLAWLRRQARNGVACGALGSFEHSRDSPTQCHLGIAPALHVAYAGCQSPVAREGLIPG